MPKKHKKHQSEDNSPPEETEEKKEEKFYIFDSNLKSIFESGGSCSFSISKQDESVNEAEEQGEASFVEETPSNVKSKTSKAKEISYLSESSRKHSSWKEYFFFAADDSRLSEGLQFFSSTNRLDKPKFGEVRKNLKIFVKHKINKNKTMKIKKKFGKNRWKKINRFKK